MNGDGGGVVSLWRAEQWPNGQAADKRVYFFDCMVHMLDCVLRLCEVSIYFAQSHSVFTILTG